MLLPCPQCRLGEGEVDQVALGKAASAAMGDVAYACQPANALRIGLAGEGTQRFAKRDRECLLRDGRRAAGRLIVRELFKQLFGSACASSRRERHHGVHEVKGPRTREGLLLPMISQPLPAVADLNIPKLEPPKQGRRIGEDGHGRNLCIYDLCIVGRERRGRIIRVELEQGAMPGEVD